MALDFQAIASSPIGRKAIAAALAAQGGGTQAAIDPRRRMMLAQAVKGGTAPTTISDAPTGEFQRFEGTGLANQGLNRLVEQRAFTPEQAAEIAAGAGGIEAPAELAARIGMARSFLAEYPKLRQMIASGSATGPIDQFAGRWLGTGESGEVFRRLKTGQDALRRLLTGAAMTGTETEEYIARYEPTLFNSQDDALAKLDGLKRDIEYVMQASNLGRGMDVLLEKKGPPGGAKAVQDMSDDELLKLLGQ